MMKSRRGDYVVLTISDNGQGLSSAEIERIFEPFFTKKNNGAKRNGTGLNSRLGDGKRS